MLRVSWLLGVFFALFSAYDLSGQAKSKRHETLGWFAYLNTCRISEHWSVVSDAQNRVFLDPLRQHQFVVRSKVQRTLGSGWETGPGMCLFLQSPQDPNSPSRLVVPELRPFLDVVNKQTTRKLMIEQQYRIEARWFHRVENNELASGYVFGNFRIRYRFGVRIPMLKDPTSGTARLLLRLNDEVHVNAGSNIVRNSFDQNRLYGGLQTPLGPDWALELGAMHWFQQRPSGDDYWERTVFRLGVEHRLDLRNNKDG